MNIEKRSCHTLKQDISTEQRPLKVVFNLLSDHVQKYDKPPTKEILAIELNNTHSVGSEADFRTATEYH